MSSIGSVALGGEFPPYVDPFITLVLSCVKLNHWGLLKGILQESPTLGLEDQLEEGKSLLLIACQSGSSKVVEGLHKLGANLKAKDPLGRGALQLAHEKGSRETVSYLLSTNEVDVSFANLATPLDFALFFNYIPEAVDLIQRYPPVFIEGTNTAAHRAAGHDGYESCIQAMIASRLPIDVRDQEGNFPLHLACKHGANQIASQILSANHSLLNERNQAGQTPLTLAAKHRRFSLVSLLLDQKGCDHMAADSFGNTALHYLCLHGNNKGEKENKEEVSEIVLRLLENKADFYIPNSAGRLPFDLACLSGDKLLVTQLISRLSFEKLPRGGEMLYKRRLQDLTK